MMTPTPSHAAPRKALRASRWSVIIPFYNEERFLGRTLQSVAAQTLRPLTLVLVDNASTDRSVDVAKAFAGQAEGIEVLLLADSRPGKINALETGIAAVDTEFVAMFDADTVYPPRYLERAETLLRSGPNAAALAFGIYESASPFARWFIRTKGILAARLMPRQAHSGGFGQAFRTDALKEAGGYSADIWPFMVADHEIIHRVSKTGAIAYAFDHWCLTSSRRSDRGRVDWTLSERLLYHTTPAPRKDWLFYEFLWRRFTERKMLNANLRDRDWESADKKAAGQP